MHQLDPGNLEPYLIAAWTEKGRGRLRPEAIRYYHEAVSVLRTERYCDSPKAFKRVLHNLPDDEALVQAFLNVLHGNSSKWDRYCSETCGDLVTELMSRGLLIDAKRLVEDGPSRVTGPVCTQLIEALVAQSRLSDARQLAEACIKAHDSLELEACLLEIGNRSGNPSTEHLAQFLRNVPFDKRDEVLSQFNAVKPKAFSDSTIKILKTLIRHRYDEWKPDIERRFHSRAEEMAKEEAKKYNRWRRRVGCLVLVLIFLAFTAVGTESSEEKKFYEQWYFYVGCSLLLLIWVSSGIRIKMRAQRTVLKPERERALREENEKWKEILKE